MSLLGQDTINIKNNKTGEKRLRLIFGLLGSGLLLASIAGIVYYAHEIIQNTSTGVQMTEVEKVAPTLVEGLSSLVQTKMGREEYYRALFKVGLKFECQKYMAAGKTNDWHIVKMTSDDLNTFKWTNKAGVSWTLTPELFDKKLGRPITFKVGEDCPYFKQGYKTATFKWGPNGNLLSISGPGDEPYTYVIDWTLPNMQLDMPNVWSVGLNFECSQYFKSGNQNDWHYVRISNPSDDGVSFEWENKAGVKWSLAPNYSGDRLTDFMVGKNCPYWKGGYKNAPLYYTTRGNLYNVKGPGGENYTHVINYTPKK